MGDPKKARKKYKTPAHPWKKAQIDEERELISKYGFKNKKEIWKMTTILQNIKRQMKSTIAKDNEQSRKEQKQLLRRLYELGMTTSATATEDEILGLGIENIIERRLQTILVRKGLAGSMRQSRQFITHHHVVVGDRKVTAPSYLVGRAEEKNVKFAAKAEPKLQAVVETAQAKPAGAKTKAG